MCHQKCAYCDVNHIYDILFTVKFMKEVTPYFKKLSPLNDIDWGSQDLSRKESIKMNVSETKTLSLKLCYLCQDLTFPDSQRRTLELHSADGKSTCVLRFPDPVTAADWASAIHSNMMTLTKQAIQEANRMLSSSGNQHDVRHMGWLSRQVILFSVIVLIDFQVSIIPRFLH